METYTSTTRQKSNGNSDIESTSPRARAIIEFIEGDITRPPVVYPESGSDEMDNAICEAILRKWHRQ
jgi:hypothetical protein